MSTCHRALALVLFGSLLITGCNSTEPTATSVPAAATRIALEPTHTPRPPTVTPLPLLADNSGGVISFYSNRDGNDEIYAINPDGSNLRRLTNNSIDDMAPAISPDGTRLAFRSGNDIYVMNIGGDEHSPREQQRLTDTPAYESHPDWSPDGAQIAFVSERDGNREIYIMDTDGSNVRRLTDDPADDIRPDWSPDGTQILFNSERDGNFEIYVVDTDGSNLRRLTDNPKWEMFPQWSPDGTQVAYTLHTPRQWDQEIYVMQADGTGVRQLTDSPVASENPIWSPDGSQIAFQSDRDGNFEIYVMNADGSNQQRLTKDPAGDYWPTWGPVAIESSAQALARTPADSSTAAPTPTAAATRQDAPSEFEGKMDVGGYEIYLHCLGTGTPTVILEAGYNDVAETWSFVQPEVARFTRVCAYDRAGLGQSDPGPEPRNSLQVVKELHALLDKAGIKGPYVLVGHSLGGMYARLFTDRYGEAVVGLVLVDSSHIDQYRRNAAVLPPESPNESESLSFYREWFTNPPTYPTLPRRLFEAGSLGDMPLVVLTAPVKERADDLPPGLSAKFDEIWVELQKEWAPISSHSTHVMAHESGHFIQHDQPNLVIDAILQVVEDARQSW